ncbi:MAG: hypothetical protein ACWIPJ_09690 [Polaribacter sp.]
MRVKESVYIITKPLQYINSTNIKNNSNKTCVLVNSFSNSKKLFDGINKYSNFWKEIILVESRKESLMFVLKNKSRFDKIYIDSDMGILIRMFLIILYPLEVIVYEEGVGNYRSKLRGSQQGAKKILSFFDRCTGKDYLGGSYRTSKIYLYHPHAFFKLVDNRPNKKIETFRKDFSSHLLSLEEIVNLFSRKIISLVKGKDVLLYLMTGNPLDPTARKIDESYKSFLEEYKELYKILKPHPEVKGDIGIENEFDFTIENEVPAELLIASILKEANSLLILHHGDTTLLNLKNLNKIKEINISNDSAVVKRFKEIENAVKK